MQVHLFILSFVQRCTPNLAAAHSVFPPSWAGASVGRAVGLAPRLRYFLTNAFRMHHRSYGSIRHDVETSSETTMTEGRLDSNSTASVAASEQRDAASTVGSEYYVSISPDKVSPASSTVAPTEESSSVRTTRKLSRRNSTSADMQLSMISNFSAAYNTVNISLALALMQSIYPPTSSSDITACSSALIAGMIFGQLGGGLLGDWLGRHMAMAVVMVLQVSGAFLSAWSGIILLGRRDEYDILACWRFILGIGCGGVYPLAATITAESSSETDDKEKLVALTFSMQGVGYLAVSIVAYCVVSLFGEESDIAWRLLLGLGSLPGMVLIGSRIYQRHAAQDHNGVQATHEQGNHDTEASYSESTDELSSFIDIQRESQVRLKPTSLLEQILNEPNLWQKLVGTAGCWFVFDVVFYGNTLFQPVVLSAAFGESETIHSLVRDSMFIALMALPGYFVSVAMVGRQTPRRIQLQGFLCMATLYTVIGLKFYELNQFSLMGLYGLTFFFSNYGPNTTTFMLPSMTFSRPCRSTLNGVCAASGKLGALCGSFIFLPLSSWLGNAQVMLLCAIVSIVAAIMTWLFTSDIEAQKETDEGVGRVSSEKYLVNLQAEETSRPSLPKTISMPTFLDKV